jgi:hypothetical protein
MQSLKRLSCEAHRSLQTRGNVDAVFFSAEQGSLVVCIMDLWQHAS